MHPHSLQVALETIGPEFVLPVQVFEHLPETLWQFSLALEKGVAAMRKKYPLYTAAMLSVVTGLAQGLEYIHSVHEVHKDLMVAGKNILFMTDERGPNRCHVLGLPPLPSLLFLRSLSLSRSDRGAV